jgi:hypothetical protein
LWCCVCWLYENCNDITKGAFLKTTRKIPLVT